MDPVKTTKEDTRRLLDALRDDPEYKQSRYTLLWVSLFSFIALALVGLMVMNERLKLDGAIIAMVVCVVVYLYFAIRTVKVKSAAEARWNQAEAMKRAKKKEAKKNR